MQTQSKDNFGGGLHGDYPTSWDEFIGQPMAKEQLIDSATSARLRGVAMDPVLLASGVPGIGKTSLALLAAQEVGGAMQVLSGKVTANVARKALSTMMDGDVLFIDEIHTLVQGGKANSEWLLHFLQDGVIMGPRGPEEQPKVTLIAATTDAGKLPEPLLERFRILPQLEPYTEDEAVLIALGMASKMFTHPAPMISERNAREVAVAACNSPRAMRRILGNIRDKAWASAGANFHFEADGTGHYDIARVLELLGITADGLTKTAQRYLLALLIDFNNEPAGQTALQDILHEPGGLTHTERVLMEKGLVAPSKRGRCLTGAGIKRANQLASEASAVR